MKSQDITNFEVAFGDDQGEGLITFDLDDVKVASTVEGSPALEDPSALRLYSDKIEVEFGQNIQLVFLNLPYPIYEKLRPLKGVWVCGLRGENIEVAEEVNIEVQ